MKPQTVLLALLIALTLTMMTFVGVSAFSKGDAQPTLLLFVGVLSSIVTPIVALSKSKQTLEVSKATDEKVDQLLNGSLQGKISSMQKDVADQQIFRSEQQVFQVAISERVSNLEKGIVEILGRLPP